MVCYEARAKEQKMNIELAYSIHLGNDKNKTKRAKEIAKKVKKLDGKN